MCYTFLYILPFYADATGDGKDVIEYREFDISPAVVPDMEDPPEPEEQEDPPELQEPPPLIWPAGDGRIEELETRKRLVWGSVGGQPNALADLIFSISGS